MFSLAASSPVPVVIVEENGTIIIIVATSSTIPYVVALSFSILAAERASVACNPSVGLACEINAPLDR